MAERVGFVPANSAPVNNSGQFSIAQISTNAQNLSIRQVQRKCGLWHAPRVGRIGAPGAAGDWQNQSFVRCSPVFALFFLAMVSRTTLDSLADKWLSLPNGARDSRSGTGRARMRSLRCVRCCTQRMRARRRSLNADKASSGEPCIANIWASTSASSSAMDAPSAMLGDVACAASPRSTTRPQTELSRTTSSMGEKWIESKFPRPLRMLGTGSPKSAKSARNRSRSRPVGSSVAAMARSA